MFDNLPARGKKLFSWFADRNFIDAFDRFLEGMMRINARAKKWIGEGIVVRRIYAGFVNSTLEST